MYVPAGPTCAYLKIVSYPVQLYPKETNTLLHANEINCSIICINFKVACMNLKHIAACSDYIQGTHPL